MQLFMLSNVLVNADAIDFIHPDGGTGTSIITFRSGETLTAQYLPEDIRDIIEASK